MSEAQRPGFEIEGRFYPFPESFRLGDPVLVTELTGMPFPEFAEALEDPDRRGDPALLIGLIGVAVWQGNPRWTRPKVIQYVQRVDLDAFEAIGGDEEKEEGADVPPDEPAVEPAPSSDSSTASTNSPAAPSE